MWDGLMISWLTTGLGKGSLVHLLQLQPAGALNSVQRLAAGTLAGQNCRRQSPKAPMALPGLH